VATLGACSAVASMAAPAEVVTMLISGNFSTDKEVLSKAFQKKYFSWFRVLGIILVPFRVLVFAFFCFFSSVF
jgi:hypothetical protein